MPQQNPTDWYPLLDGMVPWEVGQAHRYAFDALYNLRRRVAKLETGSSAVVTSTVSAPVVAVKLTLTADTSIAIPSVDDGSIVVYLIRQDATGGRTVTWDPAFKGAQQVGVDANKLNIFWYYKESGSELWLVNLPIKNVTV